MDAQPGVVSAVANLLGDLGWINRTAGHVVRVLKTDEAGLSVVVGGRRDAALDLIPAEDPVFAGQRSSQAAGEVRHHGHFVIKNVAALFADDFLSVEGVDL